MNENCTTCDRPKAPYDFQPGGLSDCREDLCYFVQGYGGQCRELAVDWRARALKAEALLKWVGDESVASAGLARQSQMTRCMEGGCGDDDCYYPACLDDGCTGPGDD